MGPNAACRPHGPSQCLVDLEIRVVMFKRRGDGRENTNHMGEGGRNRLNQWHYSLSCSCLCDTPRMARLNIVLVIMRGGGIRSGSHKSGWEAWAEFFEVATSRAQIEHHVFNVSSSSLTKFYPFLVLSLHLSPRANVDHILPTLMGRIPLRSTPRRLPQAHIFLLSPGLLNPSPFTFALSLSPSHSVSVSPRLLLPHPRPSSHLPYRLPSPSRHLPSSHISLPHPLSSSSSPLASIKILLGLLPQERVSISLPLPLVSPAPSSCLRGGSLFFSCPPPPRHSVVSAPPSRLTSTPVQLRRQIR